jgi:glycosyltransferase involved in cell wall biosynthesis
MNQGADSPSRGPLRVSPSRPAIRVTIVHPFPLENFVEFYDRLGRHPAIELSVLFCSSDPTLRATGTPFANPSRQSFRGKVLPGRPVFKRDHRSGGGAAHLNPSAAREVSPENMDVLVVYGYGFPTALLAWSVARARRIPRILSCETHWGSVGWGASELKRIVAEKYVRSFVASASAYFPAGSLASSFLADLGARREAMFRVGVPCDAERWRRTAAEMAPAIPELRTELGLGQGPIVSTVARLAPFKGLEELIHGFATFQKRHPDWNLIIVGDGPDRRLLEQLAERAGAARVRFTGALARRGVARVLAASEIFCLPSRRETWGLAVNEALAAGVPVIATKRVAAAADLLDPTGAGLVIAERDPSSICDALSVLADDPNLRVAMRERTWSAVLPFTMDAHISQFVAGCHYALKTRRRPTRF